MLCRPVSSESDRERWEAFLSSRPESHFRQSLLWGGIRGEAGWSPRPFLVEHDGAIRAVLAVLVRRIPFFGSLYYGCRGPVVDWDDREALGCLLRGIAAAARGDRAPFLRIDPEPAEGKDIRGSLKSLGLRHLDREFTSWNRSQYELRVPLLGKSLGEIEKGMRRTLRQDIKTCLKRGASIEVGIGAGDAPRFRDLMNGLERARESICHSLDYYGTLLEALARSGGTMVKVVAEGKLISAVTLWFIGDRCWSLYMANDYEYRDWMPNKLALWEGIRLAKERGCRYFDLGTTQGSRFDPESGLDGYKLGFRPEVVRFPGYFDLVVSRPRYLLFRALEDTLIPAALRYRARRSRRGVPAPAAAPSPVRQGSASP